MTDFSVKEKDEASLSDGFRRDLQDAFILHLRGLKVFYFQTSRWSLNRKPILRKISEKTIEGSALEKTRFLFVLILQFFATFADRFIGKGIEFSA